MNRYETILAQQLCRDYACTMEELLAPDAVIRLRQQLPGARPLGESSLLKAAVFRGKLLVMAAEPLMDWCREVLDDGAPQWLAEPHTLRAIDDAVRPFGQRLADTHHHYLPIEGFPEMPERFPVRWYEQNELAAFRGDNRFRDALLFDERTPDLLAVCAMEGEEILGMASVIRNCEKLWEIGVNVTDAGRGRGVGAYVTGMLKDEVLRRGAVPTYATAESHVASQRVAIRAGFIPVFYELFTA